MKHFIAAAAIGLFAAQVASAQAILTVVQNDAAGNQVSKEYTAEQLLDMDPVEITTMNDYLDAPHVFTGPLLRDLIDTELKATDSIEVTALNDYKTKIPAAEALKYDVIVAVLQDGERMSLRDKGPFWVIYPMSDNPELQDPGFNDRLIWQLSGVKLVPGE
ncbi:MAG: molybdopterin-dependent oxidoreductase [Tranquillimonas sp.]|jgi:hypothetical protein